MALNDTFRPSLNGGIVLQIPLLQSKPPCIDPYIKEILCEEFILYENSTETHLSNAQSGGV